MTSFKITPEHLSRRAVVYVRQSSPAQVLHNLESQRRQYELEEQARKAGFANVETIDADLGCSAGGHVQRPGFERLMAQILSQEVGAVYFLEASRLARNGKEWHSFIEFCAVVNTLLIDPEMVYDPQLGNDRLLLGMKGTMSEYELHLLRQRTRTAIEQKAQRGELQFCLPVGLSWTAAGKIELDANARVRQAIGLVFEKFAELGSARQVQIWFLTQKLRLPTKRKDGSEEGELFQAPRYSAILGYLRNPLYAGAYVWGRTTSRTVVVEGQARKTAGHDKPEEEWKVCLPGDHPGYISWEQFGRNQAVLAENTNMRGHMKSGSGRGGNGLLSGLLRCGRCGRKLNVLYGGKQGNVPRYECRGAKGHLGLSRCLFFAGAEVDRAVGAEILRVVEEHAIEGALEAVGRIEEQNQNRQQAIALELEQAQYEAKLARRRYEAVDPDNRLVASELEARWNAALVQVQEVQRRLEESKRKASGMGVPDKETLLALAEDLPALWEDEASDMRLKQRIARIVIEEVVVQVNEEQRQIELVVHWNGGRHSELRIQKRATGRHGRSTDLATVEVVRQMAGHYPDQQIAATLNRLGLKTGTGNTWTESRIRSLRSDHQLPPYRKQTSGECPLTIEEAAERLGISASSVRQLILRWKVLPARQVVAYAPWQIERCSLDLVPVKQAVERIKSRVRRPPCVETDQAPSLFSIT
jgi:DNA invertase Pin-like site-specific DNA recombinase